MKHVNIVQDETQLPMLLRNLFFPNLIDLKLISEITPQLFDDFLKDDDDASLNSNSVKLPLY